MPKSNCDSQVVKAAASAKEPPCIHYTIPCTAASLKTLKAKCSLHRAFTLRLLQLTALKEVALNLRPPKSPEEPSEGLRAARAIPMRGCTSACDDHPRIVSGCENLAPLPACDLFPLIPVGFLYITEERLRQGEKSFEQAKRMPLLIGMLKLQCVQVSKRQASANDIDGIQVVHREKSCTLGGLSVSHGAFQAFQPLLNTPG